MLKVVNEDCATFFQRETNCYDCIFVDPPDNIGLTYQHYDDNKPDNIYEDWLYRLVVNCLNHSPITWISFNAKHVLSLSHKLYELFKLNPQLVLKPCVQTYTFGQYNPKMFGNNHRPLWLIYDRHEAVFYPEAIKVESWRQQNGDPRAAEGGRVPGDVFDFPRVTGNSKQRRNWHPTQLNEGLVERCIKFSTREGDSVLDPCGGTGTTGRVCKALNRDCTLVEIDPTYCERIRNELLI